MKHQSHPQIVNRLKRACGHLASVIEMIEDGRSCVDLAQQLHAVECAITNAKRELIHDHFDHCLGGAEDSDRIGEQRALQEFRQLARYL